MDNSILQVFMAGHSPCSWAAAVLCCVILRLPAAGSTIRTPNTSAYFIAVSSPHCTAIASVAVLSTLPCQFLQTCTP
jgi:hypothetical protein